MSEEITCPNCGGLIFSPDAEAMELQPCTCTKSTSTGQSSSSRITAVAASISAPVSSSKTSTDESAPASNGQSAKICCKCGIDVNGRKRMKDSAGQYWCAECAKADEKAKRGKSKSTSGQDTAKAACTMCGTQVQIQNLLMWDGQFVCPRCHREQKAIADKTENRLKRIDSTFKGTQWKRLMPLLIILGILAVIMLLNLFHVIGER